MNQKLSKYLSQPAPANDRPWISVVLCVVIVIFILAVFEPFNYKLNSSAQFWVLIGFALVTIFATTITFVLFPKVFPRFYSPDQWTVGKSLLNNVYFLLIAGVGVVCYDYFIVTKQVPTYFPMDFLVDLFASLTIGIVPISIITIINQNRTFSLSYRFSAQKSKYQSRSSIGTESQRIKNLD